MYAFSFLSTSGDGRHSLRDLMGELSPYHMYVTHTYTYVNAQYTCSVVTLSWTVSPYTWHSLCISKKRAIMSLRNLYDFRLDKRGSVVYRLRQYNNYLALRSLPFATLYNVHLYTVSVCVIVYILHRHSYAITLLVCLGLLRILSILINRLNRI